MIVTRGQPPWGSRDPRQAVNQFHAFAVPYVWLANEEQRRRGLHVVVSEVQRIPPASVDPTAKNYHWNDLTMGLLGALDAGADTVLLRDACDNVVEGPGFNVFARVQGVLVTPAEGVLHGITRRTVLEIGRFAAPAHGGTQVAAHRAARGAGGLPHDLGRRRAAGDARERPGDRRRQAGALTQQLAHTYWDWHRLPQYSTPIAY
jgi:branched-chain amino acid aminotransferase